MQQGTWPCPLLPAAPPQGAGLAQGEPVPSMAQAAHPGFLSFLAVHGVLTAVPVGRA